MKTPPNPGPKNVGVDDIDDALKKASSVDDIMKRTGLNESQVDDLLKNTGLSPDELSELLKTKNIDDIIKGSGDDSILKARYGERKISDELYDELRDLTPTDGIRAKVNEGVVLPMDDFAIPGKKIYSSLEADHIVSMDRITKMDGFDKLTREQQLAVLNYEDNFQGLSRSANASKGPKSYIDWTIYKKDNLLINPDFRKVMLVKDKELEGLLQKLIDDFLK